MSYDDFSCGACGRSDSGCICDDYRTYEPDEPTAGFCDDCDQDSLFNINDECIVCGWDKNKRPIACAACGSSDFDYQPDWWVTLKNYPGCRKFIPGYYECIPCGKCVALSRKEAA